MKFERKKYPELPGVYLMKDSEGHIIYIGKAASLRKRLGQYFTGKNNSPKTSVMVRKIDSIDFVVTTNEDEALLLESSLIKANQPKYNMVLKDAKHFSYLAITNEKFPRLIVARKNSLGKFRVNAARFYGPYVEGSKRAVSARFLRKLFKIRICKKLPKKECLQYHIGNCDAPCVNKISHDDYMENIHSLGSVLEGKGAKELTKKLERRMNEASHELDFELAKSLHEQMKSLEIFLSRQKVEKAGGSDEDYLWFERVGEELNVQILQSRGGLIRGSSKSSADINEQEEPEISFCIQFYPAVPDRVYSNLTKEQNDKLNKALKTSAFRTPGREKKKTLEIAAKSLVHGKIDQAVLRLKEALSLERNPVVIETFDISTLFGEDSVGSMVRFVNGKPEKSGYRKFKIKDVNGQDDFSMMEEVVFRRYSRLVKERKPLPDLVLIDGGIGQLNSALKAIGNAGLMLPVASIAKKEEEIYIPTKTNPLKLSKNDDGLKLLQHCRDEAHRFAVSYHRKRRKN
jgi:excinuclease ABC subunit C